MKEFFVFIFLNFKITFFKEDLMPSLKVYLSNSEQVLIFSIFKRVTTIGNDIDNDIYIPDITLEDLHANIVFDGDNYFLHTLNKGFAFFNKKKTKKHKLSEHDKINMGSSVVEFILNDQEVVDDFDKTVVDQHLYKKLLELSDTILETEDFNTLLNNLLDMLLSLTRAERGYILIFQNREVVAASARNMNQENIGNPLKQVSDSILEKAISTKRPVIVSDAFNDQLFSTSESVINLKLSSVLCAPLKSGTHLIGLIYLGNNQISNLFNHESLETLTIFAAMTSLIVQNAFLLNKLNIDSSINKGEMRFGGIIGSSSKMRDVFRKIEKVAPTDISVLIQGETGTGKELVAKEIHERSDRSKKNFITINCAAIPENLMESEFFGHKKGSFTGAVTDQKGKFEMADGGTIFLDEIGEMPLNLQAKLLRVLQERMITPIGSSNPIYVNVRIIAATNKDLEFEVQRGTFREDLLYRLNVIQISLPPLREREDDIEILGKFFLSKFSIEYQRKVVGFTPVALDLMKQYEWPGNIRELENRIKKGVVLSDKIHITPTELGIEHADKNSILPLSIAKQNFQKEYIIKALKRNSWNKSKTAQELGIDARTIFRYLEKPK